MKTILKARWAVIAIWLAVAVVLVMTAPSFSDLVREKGQVTVPEGYPSSRAAEIMKEASSDKGGESLHQVALVFNNPKGIGAEETASIQQGVEKLAANKEALQLDSITDPFHKVSLKIH